ncbi:FtsH protease activity modulator HflK [Candidatus Mesenet endosymbiont of Phosphuga atrata]|uniref:FtsH protease activity modulator HflK n=1 Tax=Candidatus Mesenet endosymbiont of Phosphuga atrata TaxID=3066221 RepID=UPI0030D3170D
MFDGQDPWENDKKYKKVNFSHNNNQDPLEKVILIIKNAYYSFFKGNASGIYPLIALIVLVVYVITGFYVVGPGEESIELIFGKYSGTGNSGLRYNFPYPIGKVMKVNVKEVKREEIGSSSYGYNKDMDRGEGVMLTGDENIVNVNFEVQWQVRDAYEYLFNIRDYRAGATVKSAAESAMREVIGRNMISFALEGKGRAIIAKDTKILLQEILDQYKMGVEVLSVQLKKIDPPEKVISAFRDVQSARADKERTINEAYAYSNDIMPKAKGEAMKIKLDAEAYENEVVNNAKGSISRFIALYNEYKDQPAGVRNRIYIETMESILNNTDKVVVSDDLKGLFSYLPLANIQNTNK